MTAKSRARWRIKFYHAFALVLIPVILTYTGCVYWLFRGKVRAGVGYH